MADWVQSNATVLVRAGVHEDGYPVVVIVLRDSAGGQLFVSLTEKDIALVQGAMDSAWEQAREMARGATTDAPS